MIVGETVEPGRRALAVGAHVLEEQPVADVEDAVEAAALDDAVDAVAGRAPDGVIGEFVLVLIIVVVVVVVGLRLTAQDAWGGVLMVEDDVGEVAVDAVVDVDHVRCQCC